jgi:hypothetical protein
MRIDVQQVDPDLRTAGSPATPIALRGRSLGSAIILAAIKDYHSLHTELHESAASFLYPQTQEWQSQYDWAVALAEGLSPAWLRDVLDRSRARWDGQRSVCRRSSQNLRATKK